MLLTIQNAVEGHLFTLKGTRKQVKSNSANEAMHMSGLCSVQSYIVVASLSCCFSSLTIRFCVLMQLCLMSDYLGDPKYTKYKSVPDPYFGGAEGFELVRVYAFAPLLQTHAGMANWHTWL